MNRRPNHFHPHPDTSKTQTDFFVHSSKIQPKPYHAVLESTRLITFIYLIMLMVKTSTVVAALFGALRCNGNSHGLAKVTYTRSLTSTPVSELHYFHHFTTPLPSTHSLNTVWGATVAVAQSTTGRLLDALVLSVELTGLGPQPILSAVSRHHFKHAHPHGLPPMPR